MAFYELLVNYIYKTQPIENLSIVLALLQMVIQVTSTIIIMYISVQQYSLLERIHQPIISDQDMVLLMRACCNSRMGV